MCLLFIFITFFLLNLGSLSLSDLRFFFFGYVFGASLLDLHFTFKKVGWTHNSMQRTAMQSDPQNGGTQKAEGGEMPDMREGGGLLWVR